MSKLSLEQGLYKAATYCSRSEHCSHEVREKLFAWDVAPEAHDPIIDRLISEKFLDDNRFGWSYINDKYKYRRWGRIKIHHHLRAKGLHTQQINELLTEVIDPDTYDENLRHVLTEKQRSTRANSSYELKGKLVRFACSRGYEPDCVYRIIDELLQ